MRHRVSRTAITVVEHLDPSTGDAITLERTCRYGDTVALSPERYDFDDRLPIRRFADFEDEPTIPISLVRWAEVDDV